MTDAVKEQLSACLDGELSPTELDLLLRRVQRDEALRSSMGRYALIGEALREQRPVAASRAFAANVLAAVEREPAPSRSWAARVSPTLVRRLRPVAGMAVAAGVAAVAVLSMQQFGPQTGVMPQTVALDATRTVAQSPPAPVTTAEAESDSYTVPTTTSTRSFVPAIRLTNYVVAHSEYSSPLGRRSVLTGVLAEDDTDRDAAEFKETAEIEPPRRER